MCVFQFHEFSGFSGRSEKVQKKYEKRSQKDLYDRIKKDLKEVHDADADAIRKEMELERFLPKQITGANGIIPNQVHRKELKKILENAEHHLDFLKEKDESGYTVSERILMLFPVTFHTMSDL